MEVTPLGKAALKQLVHIQDTDFDSNNFDLRFSMPRSSIDAFVHWFVARQGRETSPLRELKEELVDETALLRASQLAGASHEFLGYGKEMAVSGRSGTETLRVAEIHRVQLTGTTIDALLEEAMRPNTILHFVDATEIEQHKTTAGLGIATISTLLLNPHPEISL